MGSKYWLLILGLAVIAINSCTARAISEPTEEDNPNLLANNVESPSNSQWETEEWLKVSLAPEAHIEHKLGTPLELECEILGTPPPKVSWIKGPFNANWVGLHEASSKKLVKLTEPQHSFKQADELESNAVSESTTGGVARVRSRFFVDHIPTVGDHRYTCIGQVGGQVVHATTTVKTSSSEMFPSSALNVRHRSVPAVEMLSHFGLGSTSGPVAPRITKWFNVLLEKIGNTVVLPCEAFAHPRPEVYWMDNNDNLISKRDSRFKMMNDGSLLIVSLKWDDMGEFHCVAKNDLGKDTKGTFLYPMLRE